MPGKHSRNKGARFEREVVNYLRDKGYEAERIPLSGAMGTFKGDVQAKIGNRLLKFECKSLANGFKFLYTKIGDNDALLLRADRQECLVVLRFDKWLELLNDDDRGGNWNQRERVDRPSKTTD